MIKIRPYIETDYKAVKQQRQAADMYEEVWDSRENLASMIKEDSQAILVATLDDKVVGSVLVLSFSQKVGRLFRLVVDERYREQGIGTQLLDAATGVLRSRGVVEVGLYKEQAKTELDEYYTKRGFQTDGTSYTFMWKNLD